jgi:hypothetical protein
MAEPPLELGAVKAMLALALPDVAAPMVGAPGTVVAPRALAVKPANAEKLITLKIFFKLNICIFIELTQNYSANRLKISTLGLGIIFKTRPYHLE